MVTSLVVTFHLLKTNRFADFLATRICKFACIAGKLDMAQEDRGFPDSCVDQKLAYSIDEVQRLVGIGRTSVFKAIREQKLKIVKFGSRSLVLPKDLHDWPASLPRPR
jgi:hypothetical protein